MCGPATFLFLNCGCGFANAAELREVVDNLRQVGIALHAHESARRFVPAWRKEFSWAECPKYPPNPNFSIVFAGRTMLGALGQPLPYVEEGKLAGLFDMNRGLADPINLPPPFPRVQNSSARMSPVPLFVCPDTPAGTPSDYGGMYQVIGFPANTPFLVAAPHMVPVRRPKPDDRPISKPEPSPLRLYRSYLEALMSPDPFHPLVAHPPAFSPQKSCHAAVAVPPVGQCSEGLCCRR